MPAKDISPKLKIPTAEKELEFMPWQEVLGTKQGGLSLYSNKFKRGYGNQVFGNDENGVWIGNAEYDGAPWFVDYNGVMTAKSAVFKDENDTTIVDASGLVSTANFSKSDSANDALNQNFTADGDVTGSSLTINTSRDSLVLFQFHASASVANTSGNTMDFQVALFVDGVQKETIDYLAVGLGDNRNQSASNHFIDTISSGSKTIKLRGVVTNKVGSPSANLYRFRLSYIILGS